MIAISIPLDITKFRKVKGRLALNYPSMASSTAPVPHSHNLPVPFPPAQVNITNINASIKQLLKPLYIFVLNFLEFLVKSGLPFLHMNININV